MKYIILLIIIYLFIKEIYYGIYELEEKQNKSGGFSIIFLAILGLIFPTTILMFFY